MYISKKNAQRIHDLYNTWHYKWLEGQRLSKDCFGTPLNARQAYEESEKAMKEAQKILGLRK